MDNKSTKAVKDEGFASNNYKVLSNHDISVSNRVTSGLYNVDNVPYEGESAITTCFRDAADNPHKGQGDATVSFDEEIQFFDIPYDTTIMTANLPNEQPKKGTDTQYFLGYCLDSGAARSVVGKNQYGHLCREKGRKLKVFPSGTILKFCKSRFSSACKFLTRLRVMPDNFIELIEEIVNADFPLLINIE